MVLLDLKPSPYHQPIGCQSGRELHEYYASSATWQWQQSRRLISRRSWQWPSRVAWLNVITIGRHDRDMLPSDGHGWGKTNERFLSLLRVSGIV